MKATLTSIWCLFLFLSSICLAFDEFYWDRLKRDLNNFDNFGPREFQDFPVDIGHKAAASRVAQEWKNRPANFFRGISEKSWQEIIRNLSNIGISLIRPEEFELSETACRAFAKHLPKLSNIQFLPDVFRQAVYELLANDNQTSTVWNEEIVKVIGSIPSLWMERHGALFMKVLVASSPPRLKLVNKETLIALLTNFNDACKFITLDALLSLNQEDLAHSSPNCINAISGLEGMNLSLVVGRLRADAFSKYNGPLAKETIKKLTPDQVLYYGSLLSNEQVCIWLELHYLDPGAAALITSKCLYGYLNSQQRKIGLGELWKSIPTSQVKNFNINMRFSLTNIPLEDFNSMTWELLKVILSEHKTCPTMEISFWTEKRMEHISPECLHRILTETERPVRLGKGWQAIPQKTLESFTTDMKSSWLNIDEGDFELMDKETLAIILYSPMVWSARKLSFWVGERTNYISGMRLYELLTNEGTPPKLGELWKKFSPYLLADLFDMMEFSWDSVHPDDWELVREKSNKALLPVLEFV